MTSTEELVIAVRGGTADILELWERVENLGFKVAMKYREQIEVDDLKQLAFLALYPAIDKFDSAAGGSFSSYYADWVRWTILKYLEENGHAVRLPRYLHSLVRKYKKLLQNYMQEYHRKPTEREIMQELNMNDPELKLLRIALMSHDVASLNEPIQNDDGAEIERIDFITSSEELEESVLDRVQNEELRFALDNALDDLGHAGEVLRKRYYDDATLAELAKADGVTLEAIRQRCNMGLRDLKQGKESDRLRSFLPDKPHAIAYRGSLGAFKNTGISSTERAVFDLLGLK